MSNDNFFTEGATEIGLTTPHIQHIRERRKILLINRFHKQIPTYTKYRQKKRKEKKEADPPYNQAAIEGIGQAF